MEKCVQLKEKGVFAYIRGHIYNELLVKTFYPQFCHDSLVGIWYTTVCTLISTIFGASNSITLAIEKLNGLPLNFIIRPSSYTLHTIMFSLQFYDVHISQRNPGASKSGRTGDKWRQKTSQVSMKVRLKPLSPEPNSETGRESPSVPEATPTSNLSIPVRIKVVDAVSTSHADGLRPYTVYYILASRKDGGERYLYIDIPMQ